MRLSAIDADSLGEIGVWEIEDIGVLANSVDSGSKRLIRYSQQGDAAVGHDNGTGAQ